MTINQILKYLHEGFGDGQYYDIEQLFGKEKAFRASSQYKSLVSQLRKEGLIDIKGGRRSRRVAIISSEGTQELGGQKYYHLMAILTMKGYKYMQDERAALEPKNDIISIVNSSNSIVNKNSTNSTNIITVNKNSSELLEIIELIIGKLQEETAISEEERNESVMVFAEVKSEIENGGSVSKNLYDKILTIGSKISSIGTFVVNLIRLIQMPT